VSFQVHDEVRHAHQGILERLYVRRWTGSKSMRRNRGWSARTQPNVALHPSVRIEERRQDIGKTKPAISHAAIVFRIIALEPDMGSVRQQPSLPAPPELSCLTR